MKAWRRCKYLPINEATERCDHSHSWNRLQEDHGRFDVAVPQQPRDGLEVVIGQQQMTCVRNQGFLNQGEYHQLYDAAAKQSRMLSGLRKSLGVA